MDYKKDRKMQSICLKVGEDVKARLETLVRNEDAESPAALAMEYTKLALVVALVLVPIGLVTLASINLTALPAAQVAVIGSIGVLIVIGILLSVLNSAMKKGKK